MKWADAISILSLALSGGIFVLLGTGFISAKDSYSTPITVVDSNGNRALLDTLLPVGEVGLIVSEDSRQERDIVTNDVGQIANNMDDTDDIENNGSESAKPKPTPAKTSTSAKSSKSSATSKSRRASEPAPSNSAELPCININDAAEADLITIKGIGPATAAKIIEYRAQKGGFRKKEDILNVKGIGPAKFAQIEGRICL